MWELVEADDIPEHLRLHLEDWDGKYESCVFADARKHDTGLVRSRIVARQFATHAMEGLFAATPDEAVESVLRPGV